ncbi:hypothetical protein F5B22DRAFT_642699 [Xylaria bambusicola]|uniref:uncharacterized protein n=1 Tax=Xylaria bambusicola TaxID=326684 RepID=UPI0020080408|nr:uncharacterized protein F5B22DRAFT_642699 [Xylaria bambusicola]KAI0525693.1 hypothetical protein F5B22DRAFT_642699 [Xylaria bambusicola]
MDGPGRACSTRWVLLVAHRCCCYSHVNDAVADAVEPSHFVLLASHKDRSPDGSLSQPSQLLLGLLEEFLCPGSAQVRTEPNPGRNPGHRPSRSCEMGGGASNDEFFAPG